MSQYIYTNQKQLRAAFWEQFPEADRRKYSGDYATDTRCAWVDWIDSLQRSGEISEKLAFRVTL